MALSHYYFNCYHPALERKSQTEFCFSERSPSCCGSAIERSLSPPARRQRWNLYTVRNGTKITPQFVTTPAYFVRGSMVETTPAYFVRGSMVETPRTRHRLLRARLHGQGSVDKSACKVFCSSKAFSKQELTSCAIQCFSPVPPQVKTSRLDGQVDVGWSYRK